MEVAVCATDLEKKSEGYICEKFAFFYLGFETFLNRKQKGIKTREK